MYSSQPSCDLGIYLPRELNSQDAIIYQSADELIQSIYNNTSSSAHRMGLELFDPIDEDVEASLVLTDNEIASIKNANFDVTNMISYFSEQSTVVPHVPTLPSETKMNVNHPLSNNKSSISPINPPSPSNLLNIKKFLVFDKTTSRDRRPLLHEFIRLVLENDEYSHIAEYIDRKKGIFKLHKPNDVAELWKHVKGRNSDNLMTYDKLARAIRYYYGSGIMHSAPGRFTFRFGPKSGFGTTWWPAY